jgi:hypothetical protein
MLPLVPRPALNKHSNQTTKWGPVRSAAGQEQDLGGCSRSGDAAQPRFYPSGICELRSCCREPHE